ncbi:MAG: hypothetical protein ACLGSD_00645 [Acidobacteriota bacterium]
MERFIQLHLHPDGEKTQQPNPPSPERKEPESPATTKRLHRILNKAARKAAADVSRSRFGIFSK